MAALIIWYGSPASTDDYHCLPSSFCVPRLTYRRLLPHGCCTHTYRLPARYLAPTTTVALAIPARPRFPHRQHPFVSAKTPCVISAFVNDLFCSSERHALAATSFAVVRLIRDTSTPLRSLRLLAIETTSRRNAFVNPRRGQGTKGQRFLIGATGTWLVCERRTRWKKVRGRH